jgi:hypothetical protein
LQQNTANEPRPRKRNSRSSHAVGKQLLPSNRLRDIAMELRDFAEALAPKGRLRRHELSFEAISVLRGELPAGKGLVSLETRETEPADNSSGTRRRVAPRRVYGYVLIDYDPSNLAQQLDYLAGLRTQSGTPLECCFFDFQFHTPASFLQLTSELPRNSNLSLLGIKELLSQYERRELSKISVIASDAVRRAATTNASLWDWRGPAPIFQLAQNVLDVVWPAAHGIPPRSKTRGRDGGGRDSIISILQAIINYLQARAALDGRRVPPWTNMLGTDDSTRDDLARLTEYLISLRFDEALLYAYGSLIDDYYALWCKVTDWREEDEHAQGTRLNGSKRSPLDVFELGHLFHSSVTDRLSELRGHLKRLNSYGGKRPDVTKETVVGAVGPRFRVKLPRRPECIEWQLGWTLPIPRPNERFLAEIVRLAIGEDERALESWQLMQKCLPLDRYLDAVARYAAATTAVGGPNKREMIATTMRELRASSVMAMRQGLAQHTIA